MCPGRKESSLSPLRQAGRQASRSERSSEATGGELEKAARRAQVGEEGFGVGSWVWRKRHARSGGQNGRPLGKESRLMDVGREDQRLRPSPGPKGVREPGQNVFTIKRRNRAEMGSDAPDWDRRQGPPCSPSPPHPMPAFGVGGCRAQKM